MYFNLKPGTFLFTNQKEGEKKKKIDLTTIHKLRRQQGARVVALRLNTGLTGKEAILTVLRRSR